MIGKAQFRFSLSEGGAVGWDKTSVQSIFFFVQIGGIGHSGSAGLEGVLLSLEFLLKLVDDLW